MSVEKYPAGPQTDRVIVRQAAPGDAAALARIQVSSYQKTYTGILPEQFLGLFSPQKQEMDWRTWLAGERADQTFVAVLDHGETAGYAIGRDEPFDDGPYDVELEAIHVSLPYQRQGVGRQLVAEVATEYKASGRNGLYLWVLADNPAREFYEHLGGDLIASRSWGNNGYFGTEVQEVGYGWQDIDTLLQVARRQ